MKVNLLKSRTGGQTLAIVVWGLKVGFTYVKGLEKNTGALNTHAPFFSNYSICK